MDAMTGRQLLASVKASTSARGPALSLPVGRPVAAVLRPVSTKAGQLNPEDVRLLTEWRNRFVGAFLNEFEANENRTAHWLTEMVGPDDTRILFMADNAEGTTFGYMGLAYIDWQNSYGEADAIVRGLEAPAGLMSQGLRTMLEWAQVQLGLTRLGVRVRSDNTALEFYRKFGFDEVRRVNLRRTELSDGIRWVEDDSAVEAGPSLVHMALNR